VDDCSQNGEISSIAQSFAGVKVLRQMQQGGFCRAANAGIEASTGEIVELLNDDAEVTAGWAERALAIFRDPKIAAVAPLVIQTGTQLIDSAGDSYHPGGFARKRFHNQPLNLTKLKPGIVFGASGSSAFYRRSALEEVGLFPEEFQAYFEDVDLAHRLNQAGYFCYFTPQSVVYHRVSASHGRVPSHTVQIQQSCNEERVYCRHMPWRYLPLHLAVLAGKSLRRLREGTWQAFAQGRVQAWRELMQ
jgi:GT2 family glycosyltransferase